MKKTLAITLLASTFTLAACGGGGGDGDGGSTSTYSYTGPTAAVSLDESNIGEITDSAISSGGFLFEQDIPLLIGVSQTDEESKSYNLFEITQGLTQNLVDRANANDSLAQLTGITQTEECPDGGSITISANIENPETDALAVGDTINATFNNCSEGGSTTNGGMSITITSLVGDGTDLVTPWEFGFSTEYDQLSIDGTAFLIDGSIAFTLGDDGVNEYMDISGLSLFVLSGTDQVLLSNYDMNFNFNTSTNIASLNSDYTYAGTDIGGSIRVDTIISFELYENFDPHAGAMTITGANDAWIKLVAQSDATNVYIEWDINPIDNVADNNATVTWTELSTWSPTTAPVGVIADGKIIYDYECASCHKAGTYDTSGSQSDLQGDGNLIIKDMTEFPMMSGVPVLDDQQVLDLAAFLDSLQPAP